MLKQALVTRLSGLLMFAFCASALPLQAQQLPTVRVAVPPIDEAATIVYAQELGYFKDAGLNVEFESGLNNASAAVAAFRLRSSARTPG